MDDKNRGLCEGNSEIATALSSESNEWRLKAKINGEKQLRGASKILIY